MKELMLKKRQRYAFLLAVFAAFFVILFAHFNYRRYDTQEEKILSYESGWKYYNGEEFKSIGELPANIEWETGRELILRNILPETEHQYYDTIVFRSSNQTVKVYIENSLIYKFGVNDERAFGKTPGSNWNYVIIPEGSAGKQIEIRLESSYKDCAGYVSDIELGTYGKLQSRFLKEKMIGVIISTAILMYGIVLIAVYMLISRHTKNAGGYAYLGFFSICMAIWSLLETQVVQFAYGNTAVLTLITFYSLMIVPIALNQFIARMYLEEDNRLKTVLNMLAYANIVIQTVLQLANIVDVYQMVMATHIIISASWLIMIIKVIAKYIKTKEKKYARLALDFAILISFGAIDLFRYYVGSVGDYAKFFRIGILIFITLLSIWYTKDVLELLKKGISAEIYEKMAYEDALTKCKNRTYFEMELNKLNEYHKKYKKLAIASFDVNDLKYNNDEYGHSVGDKLLCKAAYCISSAFKNMGDTSRIGGDEFAVILKDTSIEAIESAISVMSEKAEYYNQNNEDGLVLRIAYGYAIYDESIDKDMEAVLIRSDKKMYEKKKEMKNER